MLRSEVNFTRKTVTIDFHPQKIKLSLVAALLTSVGYVPQIDLVQNLPEGKSIDKSLVLKLTVAGFCFGNVMLLSFPEYLGIDEADQDLMRVFSWLNLVLS